MDHRIAANALASRNLFKQAKAIPIASREGDKALMDLAFQRIARSCALASGVHLS